MRLLKISAAGVRGIVGDGMDAEVALVFAQAFSTYLEGGPVAITRDTRSSGPMMRSAVVAGLVACGSRVVDLGVTPSPSLQTYIQHLQVQGAIIIGAGHNPPEWNALKFLRGDGMYLNAFQGEELLEIYSHGEFIKAGWRDIQPVEFDGEAIDFHRTKILETFDVEAIRGRRFKVAVDCCNGCCSLITPRLLEELGCDVVPLNDDIHRPFPHYPNPTPDNMNQLEALVKASRADVGFAHDVEGERLGIVTERGVSLSQEYTFALAADMTLKDAHDATLGTSVVVTNLSTSSMIDEIVARRGARLVRTPIGQTHVAERARQMNALLGGEGSGQVIFPQIHPGSDGPATVAFFLERLALSGRTLSEWAEGLPRLHMVKENVALPPGQLYSRLQRFRRAAEKEAAEFQIDFTDGVKMCGPQGWVHVRASTTESLLRIIAEAPDERMARQLHFWARERLQ